MFLKVLMHRIQVNGFDWFLDAVVGIVSRAAGSVAHIFEVGRPITGAGKTGGIYKGFQQAQGKAVLLGPIAAQAINGKL
jgi:hypothetical protein